MAHLGRDEIFVSNWLLWMLFEGALLKGISFVESWGAQTAYFNGKDPSSATICTCNNLSTTLLQAAHAAPNPDQTQVTPSVNVSCFCAAGDESASIVPRMHPEVSSGGVLVPAPSLHEHSRPGKQLITASTSTWRHFMGGSGFGEKRADCEVFCSHTVAPAMELHWREVAWQSWAGCGWEETLPG